ncbi:ribosomal RNA processing protein 1 homolog isoform X2 [Halyomorpha halys]|uniref:ribosomal RNA processing protein 1 homolog isoform X2 n=1 Tax=Halyomorpha halys TaxID=286706 RepID=UPI0006D4EC49|nr:ribosomal RNA processing protein 1 homolog isoform X2 [Halyomorpha halys]
MCKASNGKSKEELLSVAQEIAFAKALASNDKSLRDRALKKLKRWFSIKSTQESPGIRFTEEGFMRIWKGLFYCIWMSDKPLVQEECVENISNLIHCFLELEDVQKFIRCFFQSISQAWFGLDSHRLDKYLMLVRRFLRQMLEYLYKENWEPGKVEAITKDLYKSLVLAPIGLNLHLSEIYLEELAKVGRGELSPSTVLEMIKPFADFMQLSSDSRLMKSLTNSLFLQLLRQSDEGIKHQAKFEVWRQMGFPEGDIDVIQEASDEELPIGDVEHDGSEDEGDSHLDPRAGKVDAYLPPIDFDAESIRQYLLQVARRKDCTTKARRAINQLSKKFEIYSQGKYPLGIHKIELPEPEDEEEIIEKTAENLLAEEKAAYSEGKPGKKSTLDVGWKVSPLQNQNITQSTKAKKLPPASVGNWEVENLSKKRKVQCDNLVATMKRIKVTLDDTLVVPTNDVENMETVDVIPCDFEKEKNIESKSQRGSMKRKKKKQPDVKSINNIEFSNLNINDSDNNERESNSPEQVRTRQKTEASADDWGFENDWDMTAENEVNITPVTSSLVQLNVDNQSGGKKDNFGSKSSPSKNKKKSTKCR